MSKRTFLHVVRDARSPNGNTHGPLARKGWGKGGDEKEYIKDKKKGEHFGKGLE